MAFHLAMLGCGTLASVAAGLGFLAGHSPAFAMQPHALTETHDIRVFDQWDGLGYFAVSGLAATGDGRLWIATFRDLACYDGIGFQRETLGAPWSMGPLQAQVLKGDGEGRLWMGGGAVIGVLEGRTWRLMGSDDGVPRATIRHLAIRRSGEAWASWEGGLLRVRGWRCEAMEGPPETGGTASGLVVDEGDRLWCSNGRGLWRRDGEAWVAQEGPDGMAGQGVCGMGVARGGGIWVVWEREVWRLRNGAWGEGKERPQGMLGDAVTVLEDRYGGVWVGGWATGLARFGSGKEVQVAMAGLGLPNNSVTSLLEDGSGNVWVGSNGGALARVRRLSFRVFGAGAGLGTTVNSMAEEEPGVWMVGTHGGGLMRWRDGRFEPHPTAGRELGEGVVVQSVLRDRRGEYWAGTFQGGLMHGQGGRWTSVSPAETGAQIIRALHEDRAGRLWVGTAAGVAVREEGRFRVLGEADGIPHMVVHGMAEDVEGRMWVCGMGYGLFRMGKDRFERVAVPGLAERQRFASLAAGRDGSIWVGVLAEGLVRVKDGQARLYGREAGVSVGDSLTIAEDDEGHVWVWSNDRCLRIPVASFDAVESGRASRLDVRMFDRRDGFPGMPRVGFHPVVTRGGDGRLWWATAKGLAVVDAKGLPARVVAPGVAWRWARDGAGMREGLPGPGRVLALGRTQGELELGFRPDRFDGGEHVRYEARLLPRGGWHEVFNVHRLTTKDLRPGTYRLEVRASERQGEWGEPTAATFELPTPLWQREWFKGLVVVGAAGTAVGVARRVSLRRLRTRMRRMEQEAMLERERTRISQDLHDDVGAGVTQVALLLERACRVEAMPAEAMERVQEGLRVARGTMGSLDAAVWAVNPSNDTWSELVGYLGQMVVEFCQNAGFRPVLELPQQQQARTLGAEWRHHVVLIVKEAVSNAIKHSGGSEVRLRVAVADGGMELEVADDGKGLPGQEPCGNGNGLTNLASRARAMGGRLEIQGCEGRGTTVLAFIPWPGGTT